MPQLSPHFHLSEFTNSATAKAHNLPNTPPLEAVINLCALVHHVIEPLRVAMGAPVTIGSGFRSPALNSMVGGVPGSQHLTGQAADLCIDGDTAKAKRYYDWIKAHCQFDQLILEHNAKGSYWVHVSYRLDGHNRNQAIPFMLKK